MDPDTLIHEHQEGHPGFEPENWPDSPFSEDEAAKIGVPSPKKRKSVQKKRVVSVWIGGDGNGAGSKGESYPPPDSWSWRKYGQKPIKGSPYPRGYYRCSGSKGCPARKQVERSRVDPTFLLVTYSSDHNHNHHHHHRGRPHAEPHPAAADSPPAEVSADDLSGFSCHPDVGSDPLLDLDWLAADVASTSLLESPVWASESRELVVDAASAYGMMREEDETLFGDLGELPECTAVFGRRKEVAE